MKTLLDRDWTDPLPIYACAIEHPEGVILVDTGETARVSEASDDREHRGLATPEAAAIKVCLRATAT